MPSVDVVIPCYNAGRFLAECMDSVLSQNIDDLRITIIDNASTDNSLEVARRFAADDSRIEVVCHAENQGAIASFNEGIDRARGDYFMLLCADDLLTGGSLKRALEALERAPEAAFAIGADLSMIDGKDFVEPSQPDGWNLRPGASFIEECCHHLGLLGVSLALGAVLVRVTAQKAVGHYRASLAHAPDFEMVLRLARLGSFVEVAAALGIRRVHPAQITVVHFSDKLTQLKERQAVFDSFFAREGAAMPQASRLHHMAMCRLADAAYWSAISHVFRGRTAYAVELFRYCFSLSPILRLFPPLGHFYRTKGAIGRALAVISGRDLGRTIHDTTALVAKFVASRM